jgi:hypothetical protein
VLDRMGDWCTEHLAKSGLTKACLESQVRGSGQDGGLVHGAPCQDRTHQGLSREPGNRCWIGWVTGARSTMPSQDSPRPAWSRVGKNPGLKKKPSPVVFFGFFLGFLGFFGFFWVFLGSLPRRGGFKGFFQFHKYF